MAEKSIFWTTGATGDGGTAYTQAEVIRWMRQLWLADNAEEGVMKGYENALEPTGVATPVQIDTGAAIVYGFPYWSTAAETVAIPTPAGSTRIDRIVLRADWTAQTVRITRIAGTEGAGVPAIVQTDGVTWDLKICQASITTGGVITVTDERDYARPNIAVDENMLDASVAGDALAGGDGSALDVQAGTGLEISSDTIRIAAAAAGDGLQGGAGSALAVDVSDFAGTGLEDDGSENLRLSAAAAGDGLTGGAGSALETDPDGTTLENSGGKIQVKALGIDTAELAANSVDDTKAGNRVPQFYRRQGGSASNWSTQGTTDYTPTAVRMQAGAGITGSIADKNLGFFDVTFPVAFSDVPLCFCNIVDGDKGYCYAALETASTIRIWVYNDSGGSASFKINWLAIGPE